MIYQFLISIIIPFLFINLFLKVFYLFLDRGERREKKRERNINMWLPLTCILLGTWPASQACALTENGNHRCFGLQAGAHSTEPHQPGLFLFFMVIFVLCLTDLHLRHRIFFLCYLIEVLFLEVKNSPVIDFICIYPVVNLYFSIFNIDLKLKISILIKQLDWYSFIQSFIDSNILFVTYFVSDAISGIRKF